MNDSGHRAYVWPEGELYDREILVDTTAAFHFDGWSAEAEAEVREEIARLRSFYEGGKSILRPAAVPPHSRGRVYWAGYAWADVKRVRAAAYRGRRPNLTASLHSFGVSATRGWSGGTGMGRPADIVMAHATVDWGAGEMKSDWLGVIDIGEIFTLQASIYGPNIESLEALTVPVTFEHWADVVAPDGEPGPLGVRLELVRGDPTCDPRPPHPKRVPQFLEFPSEGPDAGTCTLDLPKGWEWSVRSGTRDAPGYADVELGPFTLPENGRLRIERRCRVLVRLEIDSTDRDGQPVAADIEVARDLLADGWWHERSGTTEAPSYGRPARLSIANLAPRRYFLRAKAADCPRAPWTEWQPFDVEIGLRQRETIVVPTPAR